MNRRSQRILLLRPAGTIGKSPATYCGIVVSVEQSLPVISCYLLKNYDECGNATYTLKYLYVNVP